LVVNKEPSNKIEIETPCHMILVEWNDRYEGYCLLPQLAIRERIEKAQLPMAEEVARSGASQAVMQATSFLFPTI